MIPFYFFILGLCIGSFLNVIIIRLHDGASPFKGRSMCPECKHILSWYELIPLLSFAIQQGRCRHCHRRISLQYPLIELSTGILFVIVSLQGPLSPYHLITTLFFLCILIITFVTDFRWNLIYDAVVWPGIAVAFFTIPYTLNPNPFWNTLFAALIGAGVFALQYVLSRGAWVGSGDILLGGFLGLILGHPTILALLFFTYVSGSLIALLLMSLGKKKHHDTLPLGCFMCVVGILLLFITS